MNIAVLGTGYVGLVTAVGFAKMGHRVLGYDIVSTKVDALQRGESPIYEPGLEALLRETLADGSLRFTDDLEAAVGAAEVLFVCVGTPQGPDGRADLSQVEGVARTIAAGLRDGQVVVEKSTVPVKTAQWIKTTIQRHVQDRQMRFSVASNPEFLREGRAVEDVFEPSRIVVGVEDDHAEGVLRELYAGFDCPLLVVDLETAEIIKHASNSFLATKISFINMVSDLCDTVGADVVQVAQGMGLDERIGGKFLHAGLGYGGSCFPKDVRAFYRIAEDHNVRFDLLRATDAINLGRVDRAVQKLRSTLWVLNGKEIALWGLAFKPGTDDIREAPSLKLAHALAAEGVRLRGWDPQAEENFLAALDGDVTLRCYDRPEAAAEGADAVIVVTEWPQLRDVDLAAVASTMQTPVLLDGRHLYDPGQATAAGWQYLGFGRTVPARVEAS